VLTVAERLRLVFFRLNCVREKSQALSEDHRSGTRKTTELYCASLACAQARSHRYLLLQVPDGPRAGRRERGLHGERG